MRLDELDKVDPAALAAATKTVLDSMPGQDGPGGLTVTRLPLGEVSAVVEGLSMKFHHLLRQLRGGDLPPELVMDRELFQQHLMALQTVLVVSFAIGHTTAETAAGADRIVH